MGGSKSSSASTTSSTSVSSQGQQGVDGIITAPVFNLSSTGGGLDLTTIDQFPEGVQKMTEALIGLLGNTIEGAGKIANDAITQVGTRAQEATQPDLTYVKFIPLIIGGVVVLGGLALFFSRKK